MQDKEISQQIEELIEADDMEVELESQNEDVDLIPSATQVTFQSPPPLATELTLTEEGEIVPFDDDPVMGLYNLSYDEI